MWLIQCHFCGNIRVSVQGVKSLGSHFAYLCPGFEFHELKKKKCYHFSKRKWKYFYTFNHFCSEKSSKRAKWHKSTTTYDPQSTGINLQSTESYSTLSTLTLGSIAVGKLRRTAYRYVSLKIQSFQTLLSKRTKRISCFNTYYCLKPIKTQNIFSFMF